MCHHKLVRKGPFPWPPLGGLGRPGTRWPGRWGGASPGFLEEDGVVGGGEAEHHGVPSEVHEVPCRGAHRDIGGRGGGTGVRDEVRRHRTLPRASSRPLYVCMQAEESAPFLRRAGRVSPPPQSEPYLNLNGP